MCAKQGGVSTSAMIRSLHVGQSAVWGLGEYKYGSIMATVYRISIDTNQKYTTAQRVTESGRRELVVTRIA